MENEDGEQEEEVKKKREVVFVFHTSVSAAPCPVVNTAECVYVSASAATVHI